MSDDPETIRFELIAAMAEPGVPPDLVAYAEFCLALGSSSRARCRAMVAEARQRRRIERRIQLLERPRKQRPSLAEAEALLDEMFYDADPLIDSAPPEGGALFLIRAWKRRKENADAET